MHFRTTEKPSKGCMSQKKTSHFNFRHNFSICWDFFTIFEAPCSGLIAGWCNLLHAHHRCEAFTWGDVTHDVIQAVARSAHWHRISYHLTVLTYGVWTVLTGLKSCWLFFLEYHAREGVPYTHSEYRWVETSASSDVGEAGPAIGNYRTAVRVTRVWKLRGGIFWPSFGWIYM